MKIALIGKGGMLGSDFASVLKTTSHTVYALDSADINITNPQSIQSALKTLSPEVIINCAAFTKVDACETEREKAYAVNGTGAGYLAAFCREHHTKLVHFSTDYIFDGKKSAPYLETDAPNPINHYGASKLAGELAILETLDTHYIFRIQWLYGHFGPHFIRTMVALSKTRTEFQVVEDQIGSPTWTMEVVKSVISALEADAPYGIYHLANTGYTSWHNLALFVFEQLGIQATVAPQTTDQLSRPAKRPLNSRLNIQKYLDLGLYQPATWQEAASAYLADDGASMIG